MADALPRIDVLLDADAWRVERDRAVSGGLAAPPRWLDPLWFYDERGSELFDDITRLPEYYQTRAERRLLLDHADEIVELGVDALVELGSGTSDKTTALLDAMEAAGTLQRYLPFDVSEETLRTAAGHLQMRYPNLEIHGVVGDFHHHLAAIPGGGRRLVAFLGGTIGNLRPEARSGFLRGLRTALGPDDAVLIGIDLVKDVDRIVAAYDDAAGVTAEFNRNALRALNADLRADFDADAFDHVALWNAEERWIEMRLRAQRPMRVTIEALELEIEIAAGEEVLTEISAKFDLDRFEAELQAAGLHPGRAWVAGVDDFALVLAHPA